MAKFKITEKTPRPFYNGRPTPSVGTVIEADRDAVDYEVRLGILEPDAPAPRRRKAQAAPDPAPTPDAAGGGSEVDGDK